MRLGLAMLLVLMLAVCSDGLANGKTQVLARGRVCDQENTMCLQGKVTTDRVGRSIVVSARVAKAPGPGIVSILLTGADDKGHPCSTIFEFTIRGRPSEIVREEYGPGRPGVVSWRILRITFKPTAR